MSFHGGLLGVIIAFAIFAVRRKRRIADVFDFAAPLPGIGILRGAHRQFHQRRVVGQTHRRALGFIVNGEVRHATQLYEAALEGLVLFVILWWYTVETAAAHGARGPVPRHLFAGAHHRGILARARRALKPVDTSPAAGSRWACC